MPLLFIFVLLPVLELWLLIKVGSQIGALATIGLLFLAGMVGLAILRRQGVATMLRANQKVEAGQLPAQEIIDGMFLMVGGVLLLVPGFLSDIVGLICLIPGVRKLLLGRLLQKWMARSPQGFQFRAGSYSRADSFRQQGQTYDHPTPEREGDTARSKHSTLIEGVRVEGERSKGESRRED